MGERDIYCARPGTSRSPFRWGFALIALGATGCGILLPSGFLSGLVLSPRTTCMEVASGLGLGPLRSAETPADVGVVFEPFTALAVNGRPLSGWFVPAQRDGTFDADPLGTVLMMHGTDGDVACTLPWAVLAAENRFHAVVFDYQGYGASGGDADLATQLDDSEAVLNWVLQDESPARQKVHLLGVSLGTGPALALATLRPRPQIVSVALDSAYDPEAMLAAIEPALFPIFPLTGISARLGFPWLFEMRARLGELAVPALFLHGQIDGTTPLPGARAMFDAAGSSAKSIWVFEGLSHVQAYFLNERSYVSLIVPFWRNPTASLNPDASQTDPTIRIPQLRP